MKDLLKELDKPLPLKIDCRDYYSHIAKNIVRKGTATRTCGISTLKSTQFSLLTSRSRI